MALNKKHMYIWMVAGIIFIILIVYVFDRAKKSFFSYDSVKAGSIQIDCIDSIKVNFYQRNEKFDSSQGINYNFEKDGNLISEFFSLGGTDDFDGAPLSDFHVKCSDSNVIIWYRNGIVVDTFTIDEIKNEIEYSRE